MTILSNNLKTIRKHLNCTQMAISEVLNIGFRTYVRYEAGERDAPVSVLIKVSRLGNISLDRLLTTEITGEDLENPDLETPPSIATKLDIIGGSLEEGRLVFKGLKYDFFISTRENEKSLIHMYRTMDSLTKEKFILDIEWLLKNLKSKRKTLSKRKEPQKSLKAKNTIRLKKVTKQIKKITLKG